MKSFVLILLVLFSANYLYSDESGFNSSDTIILFQENFNDGDFTNNPSWEPLVVQMCAPRPATLTVVDGAFHISQKDARTCGNWANISVNLNIPVTDSTKIQFDVKPTYSSVDDGAGWKNEEFPVAIRLKLINHLNEYMDIWFCYNYRGGESFLYKDLIRLVFPYCNQDEWVRNEVYRIRDFFPDAQTIIDLKITGSGWDYEGYADNIKIFNSAENTETGFPENNVQTTFDMDTISKSRHEKAIEGYRENFRLASLTGDMKSQVNWLQLIGDAYFQLNIFDSAIVNFRRAIPISSKIWSSQKERHYYQARSIHSLSKIYTLLNQYDSAFVALDALLRIYQTESDTSGIIQTLNSKAGIYFMNGETENAETCYLQVISLSQRQKNAQTEAKAFQNIGNLYLQDGLHQKALDNYLKALDMFKKTGDLNSVATLFVDIGSVYLIMKKFDDAIENLNNSLEVAKMRNIESLLSDIYLKLSEVYDEKGDKDIALRYFKLYSQTRTILFDREKNQVLAEQYVKYETEIKDQQIDLLKKDNEIQELSIRQKSNQLYFTLSFGGLAILLLLFVYLRYRSKQKANKILIEKNELITRQKIEIEQQVKEKETMLRELHHRVKNNLQTIYSMLSIQSRKLKDPEALAIIKPNIDRVWAMALIHHKLYRDEKLTRINVSQYINELIENILRTNWTGKTELKIHQEIEIEYLEADVAIPLGLIVNEMLCNAIKHAFTGITKPEFNITINEINANEFKLIVRDNGTGIQEKFISDHSGSFGLELINLLVAQLKGTIEIENDNGTCFTFILKH